MHFHKDRILDDSASRLAYKPSSASASFNEKSVKGLHFGQRKLLLSEIEFLVAATRFLQQASGGTTKRLLVVYAGAANGSHLPFLFSLFKEVKFILIDPAPFCKEVEDIGMDSEGPVLELVRGYCTDELCLRLRREYTESYHILLVSDIRSGNPSRMKNADNTEMIQHDNALQRGYCYALEAMVAMLKFHPPYPAVKSEAAANYDPDDRTPDTIDYLDGTRLLGVWAPKSSSEVRLVVTGPFRRSAPHSERQYSCLIHEEQCYCYNMTHRYQKDCAAERLILQSYLSLYPGTYASVELFSEVLSEKLGFPLFCPLKEGFTEQHARWVTLLYSTGLPAALRYFDLLKDQMTFTAVSNLVMVLKGSTDTPANPEVGGVQLTKEFLNLFRRGDFGASYCFPRIQWGPPKASKNGIPSSHSTSSGSRKAGRRWMPHGGEKRERPRISK